MSTDSFTADRELPTDGRRARGEASRQAILDATVRVIAAGGLTSVTHRAVAAEAGVSTALTTYHFATLDDLLQATLSYLSATDLARLAAGAELAKSGTITLADAAATFLIEELGSNRPVFIANLELQFASVRRSAWSAVMTNTYEAFVELIQHYVDDEQAARAIFSAAFGFAVLHVIQDSHPTDATCRRFVEHLLAQYDVPNPNPSRSKRKGAPTMSTEPETRTSENAWPHARGTRSSLIAQFGADRADLAGWALTTGDPLADAVVADVHDGHPQARQGVQLGIRNGLDSLVDPPDSVVAFLTDTERLPDYADGDLLDHGSAPFYTMPPAVHLISLSAGALIRVYESPSIAAVLATTGRLVDGADRRIRETGKWVATAMLPGSLRVGQPGYVATLQVRMLHANMRRLVRSRGFDESAYGTPINQVDLARTWMDFTVTSLQAEESMGFGLTTSEAATLYRCWWLLGHLLGIDARLIEGISTNKQASRVDELLQAVTGPLIRESATLAAATLDSITGELHQALNLPEWIGSKALSALARRFHGDAIADELQIESSGAADAVISRAISVIHSRRLKGRQDAEQWQRNQEKYLAESRALLADADAAQYEIGLDSSPRT